jgi:hypothetical protein
MDRLQTGSHRGIAMNYLRGVRDVRDRIHKYDHHRLDFGPQD